MFRCHARCLTLVFAALLAPSLPAQLVAAFSATPTSGNGPLAVTFTNQSSGGTINAWFWNFGDGVTSTQQNPVHVYDPGADASFDVTLIVSGPGGTQDTELKPGFVSVTGEFAPTLATAVLNPGALSPADVDGDGDFDLVLTRINTVAWFEHLDGAGSFGPEQIIIGGFTGTESVVATDLDGDDDVDVAASTRNELSWWENTDGSGGFGPKQFIQFSNEPAFTYVTVADIDSDGDPDLLEAAGDCGWDKVTWNRNREGLGTFDLTVVITEMPFVDPVHTAAGDFDGDGDADVVVVAEEDSCSSSGDPSELFWMENVTGDGAFGPRITVADDFGRMSEVAVGDLDLDGDLDLVTSSWTLDQVAWSDNTDGLGTFGPLMPIPGSANITRQLALADLDDDGDPDIATDAAIATNVYHIVWAENLDGLGSFAGLRSLSPAGGSVRDLVGADMDSDGDSDLLATLGDNTARWFSFKGTKTWKTLGGGSPGINGVPKLLGDGPLTPGSTLTLALEDAAPNALMLAWLAFSSTPFPALGGTLHASPPSNQFLRVSDATGAWTQSLVWPGGIPAGIDIYLQFIVQDLSVPAQLTLSNAITATTP